MLRIERYPFRADPALIIYRSLAGSAAATNVFNRPPVLPTTLRIKRGGINRSSWPVRNKDRIP